MKVVVFTKNNARIITHKGDAPIPSSWENAVVDPDLSLVRKLAPHHWKLVDGKVLPMDELEREERDRHIAKHGADNLSLAVDLKDIQSLGPIKRQWLKFLKLFKK